ncbi:MAG: hypothetical protein JO316_18485 [Abitibacteriaceae bacterium]|nr:hypothetical protein [Abditibacteriaceae bacterium]
MTIGDVLAVVAGIIGIGLSGWALLISMALIFNRRVAQAQEHLEKAPWASLGVGLVLTFTLGLLSIALLNHPHGLLKLVGVGLLTGLLWLSSLGAGGLALLINQRIRGLEPGLSEFKALCRGGALIVMACWLPLLGWFLLTPLVIIMSLGAGVKALWNKQPRPAPVVAPTPVPDQPPFTPFPAAQTPLPSYIQPRNDEVVATSLPKTSLPKIGEGI